MANATTETKAQRVERLKREKNPWEGLDDIRRFAREGFDSITPEWLGTYFRWWGVYTQGDGAGVIGGKNGEGKALPYFMVRIRIPNGLLHSHQLRTIANVTEKYARGTADLTVRQNIQLHWVTIQDLPELLDGLWRAGLTTMGSCGDDTRNITGCPLAGVDGDEIFDASALALEANRFFVGNGDFYNLPRKFKVCITGCNVWCAYPEINDVGLTAIHRHGKDSEIGFSLRVGGGLSTDPHLAVRLNAFVHQPSGDPGPQGRRRNFSRERKAPRKPGTRPPEVSVSQAWLDCRKFSGRTGAAHRISVWILRLRKGRQKIFIATTSESMPKSRPDIRMLELPYCGAGFRPSRCEPRRMRPTDLPSGELRTTNMQNLLIVNVPNQNVTALANEFNAIGFQ